MPNVVKDMIVREITSELKDAEGMLIVSMSGLTVEQSEDLRTKLAEQDVPLRMVPNRLTRLALKERGIDAPDDLLKGNVAISWGDPEAAIHAAKVVQEAEARKEGKLEFRGGLMEGNLLDAGDAAALAKLPSRDELRAKILGCLSGPARGLVSCLAGPGGGLARVIQARVDEGGPIEAEAPAAEAPAAEADAPAEAEAPAAEDAPQDAPAAEAEESPSE